jgi:hypothetical protein
MRAQLIPNFGDATALLSLKALRTVWGARQVRGRWNAHPSGLFLWLG